MAVKDLENRKSDAITEMFDLIKEKQPKEKWQEMFQGVRDMTPKTPKGLEPLYGEHMYGYLIDTIFANWYARMSHQVMMYAILGELRVREGHIFERITTVHNCIDYKDFIIRKGAVSAYAAEKFILPFNMEDGILVCEGKGNPDWNYSAPHGAGRLYSRTVAKVKCNLEEARASMAAKGIYTSVLPTDELKGAYKPAEVIEAAIVPTAKILHRVKPIMNLKAGDSEE